MNIETQQHVHTITERIRIKKIRTRDSGGCYRYLIFKEEGCRTRILYPRITTGTGTWVQGDRETGTQGLPCFLFFVGLILYRVYKYRYYFLSIYFNQF